MTTDDRPFAWRSIAAPALVPTVLFTIGEEAIMPLIPALAARLGADLAVSGLVAAMIVVGVLLGDVPAGWVVGRLGERTTMLGASALAGLGIALALVAPNPAVLGLAMAVFGFAAAVFGLARHALLTSVVPVAFRARALSTLGGTFRLGLLIGPFVAAALVALTDDIQSVLLFSLAMYAVTAASKHPAAARPGAPAAPPFDAGGRRPRRRGALPHGRRAPLGAHPPRRRSAHGLGDPLGAAGDPAPVGREPGARRGRDGARHRGRGRRRLRPVLPRRLDHGPLRPPLHGGALDGRARAGAHRPRPLGRLRRADGVVGLLGAGLLAYYIPRQLPRDEV